MHEDSDEQEGKESRDHGNPEHGRETISGSEHQHDREQRAHEGTDGVERLPETKTCAPRIWWRDVGNQGIARRATDAFPNAIDKTSGNQPTYAWCQGKDGLRESCKAVTESRQLLTSTQPVRHRPREDLSDRRRCLGNALNDADCQRRSAENRDHIDRQQSVDHLRGDIHQHRHKAQQPDALRHVLEAFKQGVGVPN